MDRVTEIGQGPRFRLSEQACNNGKKWIVELLHPPLESASNAASDDETKMKAACAAHLTDAWKTIRDAIDDVLRLQSRHPIIRDEMQADTRETLQKNAYDDISRIACGALEQARFDELGMILKSMPEGEREYLRYGLFQRAIEDGRLEVFKEVARCYPDRLFTQFPDMPSRNMREGTVLNLLASVKKVPDEDRIAEWVCKQEGAGALLDTERFSSSPLIAALRQRNLHVFEELIRIFPKQSIDPVDRNGVGVLETAYQRGIGCATAVLDLAGDRLTRKDVSLTLVRAARQWMSENREMLQSTSIGGTRTGFGVHQSSFILGAMSNFIQKLLMQPIKQVAVEVHLDGKIVSVIKILENCPVLFPDSLSKKNNECLAAHGRIVAALKPHKTNGNPPLILNQVGR